MNAVILAAGMSSRFAPFSFERPKGLLKVKGEILIERQIRQLQEAGISDIKVVVGYMKEMFFYLEDRMNVKIVVNDDYYKFNNTSSLIRVTEKLSDTFICSSDNYFTENVFLEKPKSAYYSAIYSEGKTDEWGNSWFMSGHVFFDKTFSQKFITKKLLKL